MYHVYDFFGISSVDSKMQTLVASLREAGITTARIGTMGGEPAVEFQSEQLSYSDLQRFEKMASGIQLTSDSLSSLDDPDENH